MHDGLFKPQPQPRTPLLCYSESLQSLVVRQCRAKWEIGRHKFHPLPGCSSIMQGLPNWPWVLVPEERSCLTILTGVA